MKTMLYYLMFLQSTIITTNVNPDEYAGRKKNCNEIEQSRMDINKYVAPFTNLSSVKNNNHRYEELYSHIVNSFCNKYCDKPIPETGIYNQIDDAAKCIHYISLPDKFDQNDIKKFCDEKKIEYMKINNIKDEDLDYAFIRAYNIFVNISTFTMDTLKKIHDIRISCEDHSKFRETLNKDAELYEKYILSVNWLAKLCSTNPNVSLLNNFDNLDTTKYYEEFYKEITANKHIDTAKNQNKEIVKRTIMCNYDYYSITSYDKFYKSESKKQMKEYCECNLVNPKNNKKFFMVQILFCTIAIDENSSKIIKCVQKSRYYKDIQQSTKFYRFYEAQNFGSVESYNKENINYEIEFDSLHMHTSLNILNICALSAELNIKIAKLTDLTKQHINEIIICMKDKLKMTMQNFFKNLAKQENYSNIGLDAVEQCCIDKMNETNVSEFDTKNTDIDTGIVQNYNVYFEKYLEDANKPILQYMKKYKEKFTDSNLDIYNNACETKKNLDQITLNNTNKSIAVLMEVQKKISEMIVLQNKNNEVLKNIADDDDKILESVTDSTSIKNLLELVNYMTNIMQEQSKEVKENKTLAEVIKTNKMGYSDQLKTFFSKNKKEIINILNYTIQLKGMTIDAEQKAYELIKL
ncbi:hypothetical protein BDAP_001082 [Binucleata daphniae]